MANPGTGLSPWARSSVPHLQHPAAAPSSRNSRADTTPKATYKETKVPIPAPYQSKTAAPASNASSAGHPRLKAAQELWLEGRDKMIKPSLLRSNTSLSSSSIGSIPAVLPQQPVRQKGSGKRPISSSSEEPEPKRQYQNKFQSAKEDSGSSFEADTSDDNDLESEDLESEARENTHGDALGNSDSDGVTDWVTHEQSKADLVLSSEEAPADGAPTSTSGERQTPRFDIALDGRPYHIFPCPDSERIVTQAKGGIFPSGYQLYNDNPDLPYICPIRSCRRLFPNLSNLRGHFGGKHCRQLLNDCRDGTLTIAGTYKNKSGTSAAFVTSREAISEEIAPLAVPSTNAQHDKQRDPIFSGSSRGPSTRLKSDTPKASPIPAPALKLNLSLNVETYLLSFLKARQKEHYRGDIDWLRDQPRRRDIPHSWVKHHRDEELDTRHYAIILAFLVGDRVDSQSERCTKPTFHRSSRLSRPCVTLPATMPSELKVIFSKDKACVGCKYISHVLRQKNSCDWAGVNTGQDPLTQVDEAKSSSTPKLNQQQVIQGRQEDHLEMEAWEFSPGLIKDSATGETIALSNAFLRASHATEVSPDVSFRVLVLQSGRSESWAVENTTLRTCSVAAGKLTVNLGDQDPLKLGPHGLFIIRPGQQCRVKNTGYIDVVVHCTAVSNHALQGL